MGLRPASAIQRLGTESVFDMLARATVLEAQGRDIIHLSIGQPDFPPPPHVVEAARRCLADGHHGYTPAPGILPLREAIAADIFRRRGCQIDPDRIVVVPGGKVTIAFAVLMFGEPGAEILYPNPGFPVYESLIRYSGATGVPVRLHEQAGFAFDPEEVLAQITPATRLLIINSPANPTGGVIGKAALTALVRGLERHPGVAVLADEMYSRISYGESLSASLATFPELADRLILLDGWSKTYAMTGWRLGYGVWPQSLVAHANRLAINFHSCVSTMAQYGGIAALVGPQDSVQAMVRAFDARRTQTVALLNRLPGVRAVLPEGAFFVFANITGTGHRSQELETLFLEQAGVATVAGTSFGAVGEGFLRISYASPIEKIRAAIERMRAVL